MATKTTNEFLGTGRRKTAIARVRLATGTGKITVNGRTFENYFPLDTQRATVSSPLTITGTADKVDVRVNVGGGGPLGHPPVYLNLAPAGRVECPYCSRCFINRAMAGQVEIGVAMPSARGAMGLQPTGLSRGEEQPDEMPAPRQTGAP